MAFSTNFCHIENDVSSNHVWPSLTLLNETFSVIFKHRESEEISEEWASRYIYTNDK